MRLIMMLFFISIMCSCNNTKNSQDLNPVREDNSNALQLDNKLIVQLKEEVKPSLLEKEFVKYSLKMKSFASRSQNSYLYVFDSNSISKEKLINKINKFDWVVLASELDKKVGVAKSSVSGQKGKTKISDQ